MAVRASDGTGTTDTARGLRQVVGHTMQTMLVWLGLVDIVQLPAGEYWLVATRPELRRVDAGNRSG